MSSVNIWAEPPGSKSELDELRVAYGELRRDYDEQGRELDRVSAREAAAVKKIQRLERDKQELAKELRAYQSSARYLQRHADMLRTRRRVAASYEDFYQNRRSSSCK